jgi:hypothetical protein
MDFWRDSSLACSLLHFSEKGVANRQASPLVFDKKLGKSNRKRTIGH